jgi:general secretion pathway protein K
MRKDKGMILITVLWITLILSIISLSLAASVRVEMATSRDSFDSERAFFMAKGAAEVVYNSFAKKQEIPDGTPIRKEKGEYIFPFEAGEARVRFESNGGLIDLNSASDKLLASMFDSLGLDEQTRNRLVDSILDWRDGDDIPHLYGAEVNQYPENAPGKPIRPRNSAFQTVDELLLVRNMTAPLFYGALNIDTVTGKYQRIPGVRELVAVNGSEKIDANEASSDVLAAVPAMTVALVQQVIAEREREPFSSLEDITKRVPELSTIDAIQYLSIGGRIPSVLVSRATIATSGVSRTVRLLFKTEEKVEILRYLPLLYKKTMQPTLDRWRFE